MPTDTYDAEGYYFSKIPKTMIRSLSARALQVYAVLGDYRNQKLAYAWPSQKTIADDIGCSDRTVRDAIRELVDAGYVTVVRVEGDSSHYYLDPLNGGQTPTPEADLRGVGSELPGGEESDFRGCGS